MLSAGDTKKEAAFQSKYHGKTDPKQLRGISGMQPQARSSTWLGESGGMEVWVGRAEIQRALSALWALCDHV